MLGPHKAHVEPLAERHRAGIAHPHLEPGAAVGSSHRRRTLSAKSRGETPSLPLVTHCCQHQPPGNAGCHDPHCAHATLAKACPHARHLVPGGRNHDDHHSRLAQPDPRTGGFERWRTRSASAPPFEPTFVMGQCAWSGTGHKPFEIRARHGDIEDRIAPLAPAAREAAISAGRQHTLESAARAALDALSTAGRA